MVSVIESIIIYDHYFSKGDRLLPVHSIIEIYENNMRSDIKCISLNIIQ